MQALILGAGRGSRLGKYTEHIPKCMVEVNDKTIIKRAIDILYKQKIDNIIFVCGYKKEKIKEFLMKEFKNINFTFVENNEFEKTNNIYSLYLAKELLLKDEDTILIESDLLFDEKIIKTLIEDKNKNIAAIAKYKPNMDGTVVTIDESSGTINKFYKSNEIKEYCNYYKTINIYKFNKTFLKEKYIPILVQYIKNNRINEYYEQVLKDLVKEKNILNYKIFNKEKWYEVDNEEDLNNAKKIFRE